MQNQATLNQAKFEKEQWEAHFKDVDISTVKDSTLKRQLQYLQSLGTSALPADQLEQLNKHLLTMQNTYSTARVCPFTKQQCDLPSEGLNLDPGESSRVSAHSFLSVRPSGKFSTRLDGVPKSASATLLLGGGRVNLHRGTFTPTDFEGRGHVYPLGLRGG